jgi:two-component system response regulator DesR
VHRPDVAVLDIDLPVVDGSTAADELSRVLPSCRVLVPTGLNQPGQLRPATAAHVAGFTGKDEPVAVRQVAAGGRVLDPALAVAALETAQNPLSAREAEVLARHAAGASAAGIATDVFLPYRDGPHLPRGGGDWGARNRVHAARIVRGAGGL